MQALQKSIAAQRAWQAQQKNSDAKHGPIGSILEVKLDKPASAPVVDKPQPASDQKGAQHQTQFAVPPPAARAIPAIQDQASAAGSQPSPGNNIGKWEALAAARDAARVKYEISRKNLREHARKAAERAAK